MSFAFGHVHIPYPADRRTEALFGWFGEYLAVNEEGRHLRLYRCPGVENGNSEPDAVEVGYFGPQPCQAMTFPLRLAHDRTKEIAFLTDEGDLRRYALTYNNPPHLIEERLADGGLCLAYSQQMDMLAVGGRGGELTIHAVNAHAGGTRVVRHVSDSDILQVGFTESGILVARDAAARVWTLTGLHLRDGRFNARAACVQSLHDLSFGLSDDVEVYAMDVQPHGHQVLVAGRGSRGYMVKLDSEAAEAREGETPREQVRVAAIQLVSSNLTGGYVRYAHFLSNNRFVLGDRNSLEVFNQGQEGTCKRCDAYDFGSDHTAIACRAHANQRLYLLTAPFPAPLTAEVLE